MNKNSKIIVLIAAVAIGAIVLVVSMLGGKETPTTPSNGTTTPPAAAQQPSSADKYKDELAQLEAQVKDNPTDAKYYDVYMRIASIYFDIGVENRFTGNLKDCQVPYEKAIKNFKAASKVKDTAETHAGIGSSIYNIQAVASYYQPIDNAQIDVADKEFKNALKIDPKNQQALFWYTKFCLKFKKDTKLAEKYLKELQAQKIDPSIQKEVEGLATAIKDGNTTSHSSTSGGTTGGKTGGTTSGATSGATQGGTGELPSGHPSIGK